MYIAVNEDGSPHLEEVPNLGATALPVYSKPDLAGDSQKLQQRSLGEISALISGATDFEYVRLYGSNGTHTHPNAEILEFL